MRFLWWFANLNKLKLNLKQNQSFPLDYKTPTPNLLPLSLTPCTLTLIWNLSMAGKPKKKPKSSICEKSETSKKANQFYDLKNETKLNVSAENMPHEYGKRNRHHEVMHHKSEFQGKKNQWKLVPHFYEKNWDSNLNTYHDPNPSPYPLEPYFDMIGTQPWLCCQFWFSTPTGRTPHHAAACSNFVRASAEDLPMLLAAGRGVALRLWMLRQPGNLSTHWECEPPGEHFLRGLMLTIHRFQEKYWNILVNILRMKRSQENSFVLRKIFMYCWHFLTGELAVEIKLPRIFLPLL